MKPLGHKAYGSIAHLPGSRLGIGDKLLHSGQVKIITEKFRDKEDNLYIQEKLDGSCVSIANIEGKIVPLMRSGYTAISSPHKQLHMFHDWVLNNQKLFKHLIKPGERIVGEWLAMAHGIKYKIENDPFVAFDIMTGHTRLNYIDFHQRVYSEIKIPFLLHDGGPQSMSKIKNLCSKSYHKGEFSEGVVCRIERKGEVDFLGKWVNPQHKCGKYFNDDESRLIWNWMPQ